MSSFVINCCSPGCRARIARHKLDPAGMARLTGKAIWLGWRRQAIRARRRETWRWACPLHHLPSDRQKVLRHPAPLLGAAMLAAAP